MNPLTLADLTAMAEECRQELEALGLKPGPLKAVGFNSRAKTLFGRCTREPGGYRLEIMTFLNRFRTLDEIRQTVMHEVIHTLEGCNNHGADFQQVARRVNQQLGYRIATRSQLGEAAGQAVPYRYVLKCSHCGQELKRYHRKPRLTRHHFHKGCGEASKGKLQLYAITYT